MGEKLRLAMIHETALPLGLARFQCLRSLSFESHSILVASTGESLQLCLASLGQISFAIPMRVLAGHEILQTGLHSVWTMFVLHTQILLDTRSYRTSFLRCVSRHHCGDAGFGQRTVVARSRAETHTELPKGESRKQAVRTILGDTYRAIRHRIAFVSRVYVLCGRWLLSQPRHCILLAAATGHLECIINQYSTRTY
ncbi:hypothetical protein IF2G_04308 [Cordyceps javanica]|nr:hypothetical protein IF2G_04308 [Cordyceps javanica]